MAESLTRTRERQPGTINSFDLAALSAAAELKEKEADAAITVISMGPPSAEEVLRTLFAYGADRVILLSSPDFAGADTLATAVVLEKAVHRLGDFDVIVTGLHSEDGGTGQVGPSLAELLDIPHIIQVSSCRQEPDCLILKKNTGKTRKEIKVSYPCLISFSQRDTRYIRPSIQDMIENKDKKVEIWSNYDLKIDSRICGRNGSCTTVKRIFHSHTNSKKRIIKGSPKELAEEFYHFHKRVMEKRNSVPISIEPMQTLQGNEQRKKPESICGGIWAYVEKDCSGLVYGMDFLIAVCRQMASKLSEPVTVIAAGQHLENTIQKLCKYDIDRIIVMEDSLFETGDERCHTAVIAALAKEEQPAMILFCSTEHGRSLAPRIAARLKTGLTADCLNISLSEENQFVMTRPAFSGRIMAEIVCRTAPVMATIRQKQMNSCITMPRSCAQIQYINPYDFLVKQQDFICLNQMESQDKLNLPDHFRILLGIGRGVGRLENLAYIQKLAKLLHGKVGATREVIKLGWMMQEEQIGMSGISSAPDLYLACGISGAVQHMAGIHAQYIAAINYDEDAPVFQHASLGLLGDVNEIIPEIYQIFQKNLQMYEEGTTDG